MPFAPVDAWLTKFETYHAASPLRTVTYVIRAGAQKVTGSATLGDGYGLSDYVAGGQKYRFYGHRQKGAIMFRDDRKWYYESPYRGAPWDKWLGPMTERYFPRIAFSRDLKGVAPKWTDGGPYRSTGRVLKARIVTQMGEQAMTLRLLADGRLAGYDMGPVGARPLSWTLTYAPPKPFTRPSVPDGYVPYAQPLPPDLVALGETIADAPSGTGLVIVLGENAPSRRMRARTWSVPVVYKREGTEFRRSVTPVVYVTRDKKVVKRFIGDHPKIVAEIESVLQEK